MPADLKHRKSFIFFTHTAHINKIMNDDPFKKEALTPWQPEPAPALTEPPKRRAQLRDERVEQLMDSCRQEILRQIIGPFGLTPAMFQDQDGGTVTTTHNFKNGVTATEEDHESYEGWKKNQNNGVDRRSIDADLKNKREQKFKRESTITSAYTGKDLPKDGQTHLDHVVAVDRYEKDASANLFQSADRRREVLNSDQNLVAAEASINTSMGKKDKQEWAAAARKKDPGKTNSESFGVDNELLQETVKTAETHIQREQLKDQFKKQGSELASTGLSAAKTQALRQAFGVLLHEFVQHSFVEVNRLARSPLSQENFLDELIISLKQIANRVVARARHALEALISGGVQGFVSNLLTFLINNFVTTAAKVVTMIREGISSLWRAIKLLLNPPENMSAMDLAREVTKIVVASITVAVGLLMEESIKAFILSIPILAPIGDVLALGLTAIATGLLSSLLIYSVDRLFDALQSKGTKLLEAMEANAQAQVEVIGRLAGLIEQQVVTSKLYAASAAEYRMMQKEMTLIVSNYDSTLRAAKSTSNHRSATIGMIESQIEAERNFQLELDALLNRMENGV